MTLHTALAFSALGAAAWLLFTSPSRALPLVAALTAAAEVALAERWIHVAVHAGTLGLALGAGLAVPGAVLWYRASGKGPLTAASVLAFIGLLQTALALLLRF
jgi:hypothetical protein